MREPLYTLVRETTVRAPREAVWAHTACPRLLNREFWPWLRMTFPDRVAAPDAANVPLGQRLCRSWLLLAGVLPVDYDDVVLVRVEPGSGFAEESTLATQRVWRHVRSLSDAPGSGGTVVRDAVGHTPRFPVAPSFQHLLVRALFTWRHRRLKRLFGA